MGHLAKAAEARDSLSLDEVIFVPAGRPWMKEGVRLSPAADRMAMVEISVSADWRFSSSDMELRRAGRTYTVDTLMQLRDELGSDTHLFLIVGSDALREMDRWHDSGRIFDLATVVVVPRPGAVPQQAMLEQGVQVVHGTPTGVSGVEIRRRVAEGASIEGLVPEAVERYIGEHGLYKAAEAGVQNDVTPE